MSSVDYWSNLGEFSIFLASFEWVQSVIGRIVGSVDFRPVLGGFNRLLVEFGWV